jgi:hypothetical protein
MLSDKLIYNELNKRKQQYTVKEAQEIKKVLYQLAEIEYQQDRLMTETIKKILHGKRI